ncbi:MAG: ParB/RepB/Spo0J family partition protein [Christensenellales bacterium]|jgi:ParB family chromosome partitioning protein
MAKQDKKIGLGRGLDALWGQNLELAAEEEENAVKMIDINQIDPNRDQARKYFDAEGLEDLAASISASGIIQPLILKRKDDRYTIVAGERRWRAARLAGLTEVPAIVRDYGDKTLAEVSLIENLQREDLNPIEEANGIRQLMEQYSMTQEEVAERIGKSRPAVANALRLLTLPEEVLLMIRDGKLSAGHGRCIAGIKSPEEQVKIARMVEEKALSVRQTEEMCKAVGEKAAQTKKLGQRSLAPELYDVQTILQNHLGTKVNLQGSEKRGRIVIEYYSKNQLESLFEFLSK